MLLTDRVNVSIGHHRSVAYPVILFGGGEVPQLLLRTEGKGRFGSDYKWVKPVLLLGSDGYIFHGCGNLAQVVKVSHFRVGGRVEPSETHPPLSTLLLYVKWKLRQKYKKWETVIFNRKITGSTVKETDIQSGFLVFEGVTICLCVTYLTTLSFSQEIQYKCSVL
jgi:hypothetical protein